MRRAPTHRWRGGRVAEGGGLLNRYTVNPVSWVRIPSPPPPKYLILHSFWSRRSGFELPRHVRRFAAMLIGHTLCRDRFRTAVVGETRRLSLLAIDVVE